MFIMMLWLLLIHMWRYLKMSISRWSLVCFFFKQKAAYELRISDWSSDVCSSDLVIPAPRIRRKDTRMSAPKTLYDKIVDEHRILSFDESGTAGERLLLYIDRRSEEHTSELQSLMRISYAFFCLKKKIQRYISRTS